MRRLTRLIEHEIVPLGTVVLRTTWLRATGRLTISARPALEIRGVRANTSTSHASACIVALGHERWALVGRVGGAALRTSVGVASKVLITRADVHRLGVDGVACARLTTYITC